MPKAARCALVWLSERGLYEWRDQRTGERQHLRGDDAGWVEHLAACSSFAFQGHDAHLTVLKEARASGDSYWYAYRRRGTRTLKTYVGRTVDLTIARLEATARALADGEVQEGQGEPAAPARAHPARDALRPHPGEAAVDADAPAAPTDTRRAGTSQHSPVAVSMGSAAPPPRLLTPKLRPPRLHPGLVARERLLAQLDGGLAGPLTLLSAPAGCGKTTLVRQWLAARPHLTRVGWVSLDPGDNDPVRFWRYVITACQAMHPVLGAGALAQLAALPQPPFAPGPLEPGPLEPVLTTFLNELTDHAQHGILVLDDYHVITAPQVHETLSFVLEHLPAPLQVVLVKRGAPPLPLARLRAAGDLCEVQAGDLRFSPEETAAFLRQAVAIPLAPEVMERLATQLDGWAAGLRLLALALQGRSILPEVERVLASFASRHRPLQDYVVGEVLRAQPAPVQDFLLRTSGLSRLTGSLCDAVTGRDDGADLLDAAERAGLFLEPLDETGEWYRYHALFAEAVQQEARRRLGADALRCWTSRCRSPRRPRGRADRSAAAHARQGRRAASTSGGTGVAPSAAAATAAPIRSRSTVDCIRKGSSGLGWCVRPSSYPTSLFVLEFTDRGGS